jgi:hypothetical protein
MPWEEKVMGYSTHSLVARSNWTCPKLACGKVNLSTILHNRPIVSVSKRPFKQIQQREARGDNQGSDILGRTLCPHWTNPRFPPSALHLGVAAHSLLCLLGSTRTRGNMDVPHWGSYNPYKGRVLEWRLRMYGMYHHSAWSFTCPPLSLW